MTQVNFRYSRWLWRALTGGVLGVIVGSVVVWFFKFDITHLWAGVVAGSLYMTMLTMLAERLQLAGGRILLGAVSGLFAAVVWWAIAVRMADAFALAAVAGICFGSAYVWSETRRGR